MSDPQRIRISQWIHGERCVVRVEVEAVVPAEDPSEPCFEPATIRWMDQIQQLADEGKAEELAKIGDVYVRRSA
jgi:hypothetical protein